MTNEQVALLLRGYQYRIRALRRMADRTDTVPGREQLREELAVFDAEMTQHIQELLRIERR